MTTHTIFYRINPRDPVQDQVAQLARAFVQILAYTPRTLKHAEVEQAFQVALSEFPDLQPGQADEPAPTG